MKFRKETEFQETEIGKIPREWKVVEFGVLFDFQRGLSYRKNDISTFQTPIRFITINDLEKEGGRKRDVEPIYLSEELEDSIINKKCTVEIGDILIAITDMSKGFIIGAPLYIDETLRNQGDTLVYSMDLVKLLPKRSLNTKFYFYLLSWERVRKIMKSLARGTNVLHLDLNLTKKLKVIEPPLEEQGRIANILSTIDRTIELYHRESERLERLKRGLMSELLTGRIRVREENGRLSFYRETELQETEIGKIPRDWRTFSLKEAFELYKGTTPSTKDSKYWGGTIPFATPTDITAINDLNMIYLTKTEKYLTEEGIRSKNLRIVPRGSLLFTSRATIGYLAINKVDVTINQGVIALIPKRKDVNILYYYYYLLGMRKKFEELAGGSTYREISMAMFSKTVIPQPPLQEQNRIANILSTIDRAIELYYRGRERLERLKRGLMDLLLTGKVRVVDDDVGS